MKQVYAIILTPADEGGYTVSVPDLNIGTQGETIAVRKNVTLPNYLNEMAIQAGVNFSQVLQEGLKQRLGVQ